VALPLPTDDPGGSRIVVVGIGLDGWQGLSPAARHALVEADVVFGGQRQLDLLPRSVPAARLAWPAPMVPALPGLLNEHEGKRRVVLASGDPMFFGVGATLARLLGPEAITVFPQVSSVSLACARLGWPLEDTEVVSVVGRPVAGVHRIVQDGHRALVLLGTAADADAIVGLLRDRGFGNSVLTVLSQLGGAAEATLRTTADAWMAEPAEPIDPLSVLAIEFWAAYGAPSWSRLAGLPDSAFQQDGQLTKYEIRALTLAALAPLPGQLLWDVGAGSGSVGIEWMRSHPACRAIAVEPRPDRLRLIAANASALGVPGLRIVAGSAPEALGDLPVPDAVFVGGAVSVDGVLDACWDALPPGGRLVANGVTVETEVMLAQWHRRVGGTLTRIAVQRAGPVGSFTGWRAAMPVTQWNCVKPRTSEQDAT